MKKKNEGQLIKKENRFKISLASMFLKIVLLEPL